MNEKRIPRSYKAKETPYNKAKKKATKPLATLLEDIVYAIADDKEIIVEGVLVTKPKIKKSNT